MNAPNVLCQGLVVPCYNEAERLDVGALIDFVDSTPSVRLFLVDDGSRDATLSILQRLAHDRPDQITVVRLAVNQGKAEAVRRGLLEAIASGCGIVGFFDADLATPLQELRRLLTRMREMDCDVLLAARVRLLGRHIERVPSRHYLGRIFASAASLTLGLTVYDTQCGAKLFRPVPELQAALGEPFLSRWVFEVELLSRLTRGANPITTARIYEEPLLIWRDIPGSKLTTRAMLRSAIDLARIAWRMRTRRTPLKT